MSLLNKKTVDDINAKGKKVLVRCDFNVPSRKALSQTKTESTQLFPPFRNL